MHLSSVFHVLGWLIVLAALLMLPPLLVAGYFGEGDAVAAFISAISVSAFVGGALILALRGASIDVRRQAGILLAVLVWLVMPLFGALPFLFSGTFESLTDAYFEAVSGLTTTGATAILSLSDASRGIVLWRSLLQWIGGLTTIVAAFTVLPMVGSGVLFTGTGLPQGEAESLLRRLRGAMIGILPAYAGLTALCWLLLMATGTGAFNALCFALSTLSTGGFSPVEGGASALSPVSRAVLVFFMLAGGTNFLLHRELLKGRAAAYVFDPEWRLYAGFAAGGAILLCLAGFWLQGAGREADTLALIGRAIFIAVSALTTTGFESGGGPAVSLFVVILIIVLMLIGASTGSTGGGLKALRLSILFKHSDVELSRLSHPHGVFRARHRNRELTAPMFSAVWAFFALYLLLLAITTSGLAAFGLSFSQAFMAAAGAISNTGPIGAEVQGELPPYGELADGAKWILCGAMALGRIEIFAALSLLNMTYWKN